MAAAYRSDGSLDGSTMERATALVGGAHEQTRVPGNNNNATEAHRERAKAIGAAAGNSSVASLARATVDGHVDNLPACAGINNGLEKAHAQAQTRGGCK